MLLEGATQGGSNFFMTPGWTTHWKRMFEQEFGNMSLEIAKRLF